MCIPPHAPHTLWTHSNGRTPQDQQAPYPTTVTYLLSPTSFPIGCRVAAAPSHTKYTNTNGTVTRHTAKFVEFAPGNCPPNTIHILHKSLTITSPLVTTPSTPCTNMAPRRQSRADTGTKRTRQTTLHMTTSLRQQNSLSPTDLSASHACFATWVLSSIKSLCDDNDTSRHESRQPLLRWVH
jgi:hypothetical protein